MTMGVSTGAKKLQELRQVKKKWEGDKEREV